MGFNVRSIGAFAGGAAKGMGAGVNIKNAKQEGERLDELYKAHKEANQEIGSIFKDFMKPSPFEQPGAGLPGSVASPSLPSFTGAAATDAANQPAAQFGGAAPNVNAALQPQPTPMLTAAMRPRRVTRLPFTDAATFAPNEE